MARVSNAKAKAKKQKIALAVGGVLLLGLLAIQGPKFLKLMKGPSAPAAAAATTSTSTSTPTPTTAASPSATAVVTSDKLASLSLFRAKDPFVQLVSEDGSTPSSPAKAPAPAPPPPPPPAPAPAPVPAKTSSGSGPLFGTVSGGGAKAGGLPTARILLNGAPTTIALGHSFPAAKPVFRLAGVLAGGVSISLVNGGLADGASALKLRKGQSLTLMNTVDRHRYTIKLVATKAS
jgi:hypothetical protein